MNPKVVIFDVDGVMTTGQFLYSADGKAMKVFGPDDNDALNELANFVDFRFVEHVVVGVDFVVAVSTHNLLCHVDSQKLNSAVSNVSKYFPL